METCIFNSMQAILMQVMWGTRGGTLPENIHCTFVPKHLWRLRGFLIM